MVIVHVNQTDDIQFLYECPASTDCHELAVRLSEILNEILKSSMLVKEVLLICCGAFPLLTLFG